MASATLHPTLTLTGLWMNSGRICWGEKKSQSFTFKHWEMRQKADALVVSNKTLHKTMKGLHTRRDRQTDRQRPTWKENMLSADLQGLSVCLSHTLLSWAKMDCFMMTYPLRLKGHLTFFTLSPLYTNTINTTSPSPPCITAGNEPQTPHPTFCSSVSFSSMLLQSYNTLVIKGSVTSFCWTIKASASFNIIETYKMNHVWWMIFFFFTSKSQTLFCVCC